MELERTSKVVGDCLRSCWRSCNTTAHRAVVVPGMCSRVWSCGWLL